MSEIARSFYGGQAPLGNQGGEITAGRYDGPEAHVEAPWKCPACAKENEGPLKFGCVHCGSGQPGKHVGIEKPVPKAPPPASTTLPPPYDDICDQAMVAWVQHDPQLLVRWINYTTEQRALTAEGFRAGWRAAQGQTIQHAPPMTADVDALAPAGKPRRTIVAALEIFRDQILPVSAEEIASGEWCSVEEIEQLIDQLTAESPDAP